MSNQSFGRVILAKAIKARHHNAIFSFVNLRFENILVIDSPLSFIICLSSLLIKVTEGIFPFGHKFSDPNPEQPGLHFFNLEFHREELLGYPYIGLRMGRNNSCC